jgi:tRNA (guanine-N7-)-methyltransferase
MVAPGMRRYKVRTDAQATLVGPPGADRLDLPALFGGGAPVRLEIGCGHGEFISQLAAAHPSEHIVGVEYDHLRVTKCAHKCLKEGATNVRVFAAEAHAFVAARMPDASVHRIYVLFPDPWPKATHRRRRLVNLGFLRELTRVAAPGCIFAFASDTHNYALQVLSNLTLLPGAWSNRLAPAGYAVDLPVRFPTVFERHKRDEGCTILHLRLERQAG